MTAPTTKDRGIPNSLSRAQTGLGVQCTPDFANVPVVNYSTLGTRPLADAQWKCFHGETTIGTTLARRIPPVYTDQCPAVPFCLVLQLPDKLRPAGILDGAVESGLLLNLASRCFCCSFCRSTHVLHCQCFYADRLVLTNQFGA